MDNFKRIRNPTNPHTYIYISQKEIDEDMNAQTDEITKLQDEVAYLKHNFKQELRFTGNLCSTIEEKDKIIGRTDKTIKDLSTRIENLNKIIEAKEKKIEKRAKIIENQSAYGKELLDIIKDKDEVIEELKNEKDKISDTLEGLEKLRKSEVTTILKKGEEIFYLKEENKNLKEKICTKEWNIEDQSEQLDQLLDVIKGKDAAIKELIGEKYAILKSLEASEGIRKSQVTKINDLNGIDSGGAGSKSDEILYLQEENKKLKETIFRKEERINELDNFVTRKDREIKSNWSDLHRLRMEQRTSSEENRNLSDQVDQLLDVIKGKDELIKSLERTIKSICETHNKWVLSVTKMK